MLDGAGPEIIARPQRAVVLDLILGGQEQADALHAGRGIRGARDDQVADVLRRIVVAPGNEDLLARKQPAAVSVRPGDRGEGREIRPGLRLGQAHGAGPFARDQLRQHQPLLALGAVQRQRLDGALRQHGAEAERHVGRMHHLEDGQLHGLRQALAAEFRIRAQRVPAALDEGLIGLGKAWRGGDVAVLVSCALGVAATVQGRQHVGGEAAGVFQHRGHCVGVEVGESPGDQGVVADGGEREGEVPDGRAEGHERLQIRSALLLGPRAPDVAGLAQGAARQDHSASFRSCSVSGLKSARG